MLEFIIKYWLEVGFGLVCGALAWFAKRYVKLVKKEKDDHEATIIKTIKDEMNSQYDKTQKQMDNCYKNLNDLIERQGEELRKVDVDINNKIRQMQKDVLDIEGAYFRNECRSLLREDHIITEREFTNITIQHTAYNSLGGNHEGDALYEMVQEKHKKHLV
jgi:hypothetical protein